MSIRAFLFYICIMQGNHPIGIFDSGFGGLTVFKSIKEKLPDYDYIYLGDNARAPYGDRSHETVYEFTLEAVEWLMKQGCPLIILACNTASAKALRNIQQKDLPRLGADKRVLGVIRPTAEVIGEYSKTGSVGILGTKGTVSSGSYLLEIEKFYPNLNVYQQACPLWVHMIEHYLYDTDIVENIVKKDLEKLLEQSHDIDTVLLGCTHYPILQEQINRYLPHGVRSIAQGDIVADSLVDYLQRHPEMEQQLTKKGNMQFFTTDSPDNFDEQATRFFGQQVHSEHLHL